VLDFLPEMARVPAAAGAQSHAEVPQTGAQEMVVVAEASETAHQGRLVELAVVCPSDMLQF
jgi:hypothetical protein